MVQEQILYQNSEWQHLEYLEQQIEQAAAVVAQVEPQAQVYLYGSMARRLYKNAERFDRKNFCDKSDADILIKLPDDIVGSCDGFRKFCEDLRHKLYGKERPLAIDEHIVTKINGEGRMSFRTFDFDINLDSSFLDEIINEEMILLYENGKWFIPWREAGFVPQLPEKQAGRIRNESFASI